MVAPPIEVASGGAFPTVRGENENCSPNITSTSPGATASPGPKVPLSTTPWKEITGGPLATTSNATGTVTEPFAALDCTTTEPLNRPGLIVPGSALTVTVR